LDGSFGLNPNNSKNCPAINELDTTEKIKIAYNAILCYLGWQREGEKFKFHLKNFSMWRWLGRAGKAGQKEKEKKLSSGGSEIAGRFGNFSNTHVMVKT
jgi:hypothetical protein